MIASEDRTITYARYAAGEHVAGRHIHREHTDAFYVLEGEVIFEWDIAPIPADGGLPADHAIISRLSD